MITYLSINGWHCITGTVGLHITTCITRKTPQRMLSSQAPRSPRGKRGSWERYRMLRGPGICLRYSNIKNLRVAVMRTGKTTQKCLTDGLIFQMFKKFLRTTILNHQVQITCMPIEGFNELHWHRWGSCRSSVAAIRCYIYHIGRLW